METLYHADLFIPDWFTMPTERAMLSYTRHALYATNNDRYGAIPVFESIPLCQFTLIELGVKNGKPNQFGITAKREVSKIVVRGKFDEDRDVVFVLIPEGEGRYTVKTVWMNMRTDTHNTLNKNRYAVA